MPDPSFFSEGNVPRRTDSRWRIEQKILGAVRDNGTGGGGGGGLVGSGSPEGVETAEPGVTYLDVDADSFWVKESGSGNTGWLQLIA